MSIHSLAQKSICRKGDIHMNKLLLSVATTVAVVGGTALAASVPIHVSTTTYKPGTSASMTYKGSPDEVGQSSSTAPVQTASSTPAQKSTSNAAAVSSASSQTGTTQPAFPGATSPNPNHSALQESEAHWATLPNIPSGWHWINFRATGGTINRVWVPIPDTWYNKPQYNQSGPVNNLIVWGNHSISPQGARFGYGVTISEYPGTPSGLVRGPLGHNGDMSNPAIPFERFSSVAGHVALISVSNYDPVSGNTGQTLLVKNGADSIDVTIRIPAPQVNTLETMIHDVRFGFR